MLVLDFSQVFVSRIAPEYTSNLRFADLSVKSVEALLNRLKFEIHSIYCAKLLLDLTGCFIVSIMM